MPSRLRVHALVLAAASLFLGLVHAAQPAAPAAAERIADGVLLHRLADPALLSPSGPVSVHALQLDPRKVTLEVRRGPGEDPGRQTVDTIARARPGAIAAVNAGFFSLETGRPTALLKMSGRIVHGTSRPRGAVAIVRNSRGTDLLFDRVTVSSPRGRRATYETLLGTRPADWARAPDAVGGAGLLLLDGRELTDWTDERISAAFDTTRHPRTLIGERADGSLWLITVDGRQPSLSLGMSFTELQALCRRLELRSALNLDGGGSTTMWAGGQVVNRPSDAGGPRKVSDAIVVVPRGR